VTARQISFEDRLLPSHPRTLGGSSARSLGAYYTPPEASRFMARWSIRRGDERVLEPSVGDGVFVGAVDLEARRRGAARSHVTGVELAHDTYSALVAGGMLTPGRAINDDFLAVPRFEVDVAIGNPPFVRLRHLPAAEAARARRVAGEVLGRPMEPDASLWLPFVLHATDFLASGGRLAFVLPYDATYVRYARPLWRYLGSGFDSIRVIRVHERVFPDILQDVILLLADGWGGSTNQVDFEAYATRAHLMGEEPIRTASVHVERVAHGERAFVEALLPDDLVALLHGKLAQTTVQARERVAFNIGYVCGDKTFFHPSEATVAKFDLPATSLREALISSRLARKGGLRTSGLPASSRTTLFLPPASTTGLTQGERKYIASGVDSGVSRRYKCRVRNPWYVTPDVRRPDVVLPVFADQPMLLINDDGLATSNSMLAGYLKMGTAEELAAAWYTTLTLLEVEVRVHSLGGGVMIFIPGEASQLRIARQPIPTGHLGRLDAMLKSGRIEDAYRLGDGPVLADALGLTAHEVERVAEGIAVLRYWRSARPRTSVLVEDVPEDEPLLEGRDEPIDERVDAQVEVGH
jgi:hypothetical protein